MAIVVLIDLPGVTADQYDAIVEESQVSLPPGALSHVAGPTEGGMRVVDVWGSQEEFNAFLQGTIAPIMAKLNIQTQPRVEVWPVHRIAS